jgi:hypothetical protein
VLGVENKTLPEKLIKGVCVYLHKEKILSPPTSALNAPYLVAFLRKYKFEHIYFLPIYSLLFKTYLWLFW